MRFVRLTGKIPNSGLLSGRRARLARRVMCEFRSWNYTARDFEILYFLLPCLIQCPKHQNKWKLAKFSLEKDF